MFTQMIWLPGKVHHTRTQAVQGGYKYII